MSEYSIPVLSEQEREELIKHNTAKVNALTPQFMKEKLPGVKRHLMCELNSAKIALAALTAKPVDPADCFCEVYLAPPVPVKQEGEHRD